MIGQYEDVELVSPEVMTIDVSLRRQFLDEKFLESDEMVEVFRA